MGRILDSLKHPAAPGPGRPAGEHPPPARSDQTAPVEPVEAEADSGEVVPFIEVGPHRSMEASADVLASQPRPPVSGCLGPRLLTPEPPGPESRKPKAESRNPNEDTIDPVSDFRFRLSDFPRSGPRFAAELVAYHQPEQGMSQQYQRLLEPMLADWSEQHTQVLLFSSARPRAGTTTVLLNCAITAARHAHRHVVVVDGNLRRPALAERLGLGEVPGLRDVLGGKVPLERALQETDQVDLFALTAGQGVCGLSAPPTTPPPTPGGVQYRAETFRSLLRQLRQRFDLVLVDGPRWDGQPDVVMLGTLCDRVYLVVSEKEAESVQVDDLYQRIPEAGACLAGCILA